MTEYKISVPDTASFAEALAKREEQMKLFTPTLGNGSLCAKQVTENNKVLKDMKSALEEAKKPYLDQLNEAFKPFQELIDNFKAEAEAYQKANLLVKKDEFKEEAKAMYAEILTAMLAFADSIEAPDFEEVYDDSLYQMTKAKAKDVMQAKIVKEVKSKQKCFVTFTFTDNYSVDKARELLIREKIHFTEDKI